MSRFPRAWPIALISVLLCAALGSCSRPATANNSAAGGEAKEADQSSVPFQNQAEARSTDVASAPPFQGQDATAAAGANQMPGQSHAASLPAGTLLTVRLQNPIPSDSNVKGIFSAVVDEPVVVEGTVLVARGTEVIGRVESVQSSQAQGKRCCVRLTLDSIDISGKDLPIQTSTLFAHRGSRNSRPAGGSSVPGGTRLATGRRLTFRLAQATYVSGDTVSSR